MSIIDMILGTDYTVKKDLIELRKNIHDTIDGMTADTTNKHLKMLYNGHRYILEDYVIEDIGYEEASSKMITFFKKYKKDI